MFRRLPTGLPKDPVFATNLKGLGYFVNEDDEIRNIENPKAYFKFFLTKNERYNTLQREGMNQAVRDIISDRLEKLGLEKIRLPLGASAKEPNVPIFVSCNLKEKKRIVVLFYEHKDDLGVLAHRIIGGPGGINNGSVVNLVKALQANADSPGIIIANMGQLRWWRRGKKAVTSLTWNALPAKSAVEAPLQYLDDKNTIPGNRSTAEHVEYVFDHVIKELANPTAQIQVIGVATGSVDALKFLDANFENWGGRLSAFASLAPYTFADEFTNSKFARWFVDRGRAYLNNDEPNGTFLADFDGSDKRHHFVPAFGCPVFSLGVPYYSEVLLPTGYQTIVKWFEEVYTEPGYENPHFIRIDNGEDEEERKLRELDDAEAETFKQGMSDWADMTKKAVQGENSISALEGDSKAAITSHAAGAKAKPKPGKSIEADPEPTLVQKITQGLAHKVEESKSALEAVVAGESRSVLVEKVAQVLGLGAKSDEAKEADTKEAELMAAKLKSMKLEAIEASAAKSEAAKSKTADEDEAWNARLRAEED